MHQVVYWAVTTSLKEDKECQGMEHIYIYIYIYIYIIYIFFSIWVFFLKCPKEFRNKYRMVKDCYHSNLENFKNKKGRRSVPDLYMAAYQARLKKNNQIKIDFKRKEHKS